MYIRAWPCRAGAGRGLAGGAVTQRFPELRRCGPGGGAWGSDVPAVAAVAASEGERPGRVPATPCSAQRPRWASIGPARGAPARPGAGQPGPSGLGREAGESGWGRRACGPGRAGPGRGRSRWGHVGDSEGDSARGAPISRGKKGAGWTPAPALPRVRGHRGRGATVTRRHCARGGGVGGEALLPRRPG